jgi:tRNA-dihydrouridine synthase B
VVRAVDVPVTLKYRTGWDSGSRNDLRVARIAEDSGIKLLSLHGRTRACGFSGEAEYDTIRQVKAATRLPVVANGDIASPERARAVLEYTGADGVMIGRAAQGRPWIFREIDHYLTTGATLPPPLVSEIREVLLEHLHDLYVFYGRERGVKIARKHISWYTRGLAGSASFRHRMNQLDSCEGQLDAVNRFFANQEQQHRHLRYVDDMVMEAAA